LKIIGKGDLEMNLVTAFSGLSQWTYICLPVVPAQSTSIVCTGFIKSNLNFVAVNRLALHEIGMNDRAGDKSTGRKERKRDDTGDLHVDGLKF
jgi:hypothetical protein